MRFWKKPLITRLEKVFVGSTFNQFDQILILNSDAYLVELYGGFTIIDEIDIDILLLRRWNVRKHRRTGYVSYQGRTESLRFHRLITCAKEIDHVDHRNGIGWDNRRNNLRQTDAIGNARNQKPRLNKKYSKYKGVNFDPKKNLYRARIMVNRKAISLGRSKSEEAAAKKYDEAAKKYFGEFAVLNFND